MTDQPTFADELARLEALVRQLEGGELDLDQALKLFEEGVQRLRVARELLERSEQEVRRVIREADGSLGEHDLDV
jgi:exodeoxyribonuclease VII small subunit